MLEDDVRSVFHQHLLPSFLCDYFCLPRVAAGKLGIRHIFGMLADAAAWWLPQMAVAPMGWTCALYFWQRAHDKVLSLSPAFEPQTQTVYFQVLRDVKAEPIHYIYVGDVLGSGGVCHRGDCGSGGSLASSHTHHGLHNSCWTSGPTSPVVSSSI